MKRVGQWIFILFFLTGFLWTATSTDYYALGFRLYQQRQYAKSIQHFKAAAQLDPQNWKAYQIMGQAYYQLGARTNAVQMTDQSLQINPNNQSQFRNNLSGSSASVSENNNQENPTVKGGGPLGLGLEISNPDSW